MRSVGSGPTAVLWHSMFVDSRSFDRVVPRLSAVRRLLLVDGPGYGGSDPLTRRSSLRDCALAAADLLDSLGEGPVDWVGNAWGGHVGYVLAGEHPRRLRTLVAASSPTHPFPQAQRHLMELLSHAVQLVGAVGPLRGMIENGMLTRATRATDRDAVRLLRTCLADVDRRSLANAVRSFIVDRDELGDELARTTVPVLLLVGDDRSELTPQQAQDVATRCPNARVEVLRAARTLLPVEQPDAFADSVLQLWTEHTP